MDIKMLKQQKINEKLQNILTGNTFTLERTYPKENNYLEVCLGGQIGGFIDQYQKRQEEPKNYTQQQMLKVTSRLIEQQLKRLERERLEEEKRQKAKNEFMERYHAEQIKGRSDEEEKFEMEENDLQWNSSAVEESEKLFLQISREWGMDY